VYFELEKMNNTEKKINRESKFYVDISKFCRPSMQQVFPKISKTWLEKSCFLRLR